MSSIKNSDQLIDLAGVSYQTYKLFLKMMPKLEKYKVSTENRLLIFFCKLKTGLTYSALGLLFSVHRTTISKIFLETLEYLTEATADAVRWIDKDVVQGMIPDCFKPKYSNTRVIIDCTEFPIEIPPGYYYYYYYYYNY